MTNILSPKAPAQNPVAVAPPPTMPDSQSPEVMEARRRASQEAMSRAGRSSTILSKAMGGAASSGTPAPYSGKTTGGV
ncbi:MAG: hypothetical protein V4673_14500 [Pseudomonadota bacterium]